MLTLDDPRRVEPPSDGAPIEAPNAPGAAAAPGSAPSSESAPAGEGRPHAVVIGAGFGGLAAALRLTARGWRVTVLERLDQPGGRACVHRQDGYVFDAGPTIITAPFLFEELWELFGERMADHVALRAMTPFYRIRFNDGSHFDCSDDADAMRAEIARLSPADLPGYARLLEASRARYHVGFEKLGQRPFTTFAQMAAHMPEIAMLRGDRSVYQMVARHIREERLRIALSYHPLLIGGNPFAVTSMYCLIQHLERGWGVHYAMGGMGALVRAMTALLERRGAPLGARLRLGAEVAEIEAKDGRATGVRLASGERIAADIVVSNADPAWMYRKMLPGARRRRWTDAKLARMRYSMSLFIWHFGTTRRYDDVKHHTIVLGPRYRELIKDIFRRHKLADDMSLYLYRPTATDPSMAPPGCDSFYALVPVPHLDADVDWEARAEGFRQAVQARLEATVLPGLGDAVATSRITTPLEFRDRLLSYKGAGFAMEPTLFQSAWFRPTNKSEELDGLYLVGAGTHPGAGLPGVLSSAKLLDQLAPSAAEAREGAHAAGL